MWSTVEYRLFLRALVILHSNFDHFYCLYQFNSKRRLFFDTFIDVSSQNFNLVGALRRTLNAETYHWIKQKWNCSPVRAFVVQVVPWRELRVRCHLWLRQIVIFGVRYRNRISCVWVILRQASVHIYSDLLILWLHQNAWWMTSKRWTFLDEFVIFSLPKYWNHC